MTYTLRETTPNADHNNSDIALEVFGSLTPEEFASGVREESQPMIDEFDALWTGIQSSLQSPIQNQPEQYGGFTGHRIVTFEGEMGRAALGFQIKWNGSDQNGIIIANRRKIYPDNRRRVNYVSDELVLFRSKMDYQNERLKFDLGVMAVWLDKFNAAGQ